MKISASWPAVPAVKAREFPYLARYKGRASDEYFLVISEHKRNSSDYKATRLSDGEEFMLDKNNVIPLESGVKVTLEQE